MLDSPLAVIARFQKEPPVSVSRIAEALGLRVIQRPLGSSVSAMIQRDTVRGGRSDFVIYLNANEPTVRQRFSLAHEIAHFVLHRDLIETGITDDTMYRSAELSSYYETQANRLAADILMPVRLVKDAARTTRDVAALASAFGVSKTSMEIRMRGLNI